ncbi:MAG: hypothetical protein HY334_09085, partial [Armatimonadetes bacterium]|nr:hypothetical protein [Armatimonadota bacterium]
MSPPGDPLEALRPYLANRLPSVAAPYVAGVVGDHPSTYSRSPAMWNAAFAALALPAVYVPFDVAPEHLEAFLAACRTLPALLGLNVTVPYKERAAAFLDTLDSDAAAAGAVNTILRTPEGALIGANTDGLAAHQVLETDLEIRQPADGGRRVLLLGAGGAARAVGVTVAARIPHGEILISARRAQRAAS